MLESIRSRYPRVLASSSVVLWLSAIWKPIDALLGWLGLIDTIRAAMEPHYWLYELIFWPHLGTLASILGISGLFGLMWLDRHHPRTRRSGVMIKRHSSKEPELLQEGTKRKVDVAQQALRSIGQTFSEIAADAVLGTSQRQSRSGVSLSPDIVGMDWFQTTCGLDVSVTNETTTAIRNPKLVLVDLLRKQDTSESFTEVRGIHSSGSFQEITLSGSRDIFPGESVVFDLFIEQDNGLRFQGLTKDGVPKAIVLEAPGIWKAVVRVEAMDQRRTEDMFFQWSHGETPEPFNFPPSYGGGAPYTRRIHH